MFDIDSSKTKKLAELIGYDGEIKHFEKFYYQNNDQYCYDNILLDGGTEMKNLIKVFTRYLQKEPNIIVDAFNESAEKIKDYLKDYQASVDYDYFVFSLHLINNDDIRFSCRCEDNEELEDILKHLPIFAKLSSSDDSNEMVGMPIISGKCEDLKILFSQTGKDFVEFVGSLICDLCECTGYDYCLLYEEEDI